MTGRINWKKKAEELESALRRARSYAFDYGNATGECPAGYLQQEGLICHRCGFGGNYRTGCPNRRPTP